MRTLRLEIQLTALTALAHNGGESFGTESKFRRVNIIDALGEEASVPEISGNAMRGLLRDLVHAHLCRAIGYGEDGKGLTLPAFHFLFSGGGLHAAQNGLDIAQIKRLRAALPTVALFGGGIGNALIPGKLKCGAAILACLENAARLPASMAAHPALKRTCWSYLSQEMNTRKDDSKNPERQELLEPKVRLLLEQGADAKRAAKAAGSDRAAEPGASAQMMYQTEVLIAGSVLSWVVTLEDVTDVEWEAFLVALAELSRKPWIGGKSGTGHGEFRMECLNWTEVNQRIAPASVAVAAPAGSAYAAHLAANADAIRAALVEIL